MNRDQAVVLGIETSCDETSVGIVRGDELLANVVSSSMDQHRRFGGVVPEVAARAHVEALPQVLTEAIERAGSVLVALGVHRLEVVHADQFALLVRADASKLLPCPIREQNRPLVVEDGDIERQRVQRVSGQ
mgnify:CR=1 FL=1